jgi:hypothetical protein
VGQLRVAEDAEIGGQNVSLARLLAGHPTSRDGGAGDGSSGLSSDLRPLISEIVKRVVTVKQVRPSSAVGEVGPGAWVCVRPMRRASAGAAVCAAVPKVRDRRSEIRNEAPAGWPDATPSDL